MATKSVPGASPRNKDELDIGCWAEDDGGDSLILVVGREDKQVIYQMYDLQSRMFYADSMMEDDFKRQFSAPPVGSGKLGDTWTWHDKTSFPWDRVMQGIQRPSPQPFSVADEVKTTVSKIASLLGLRGQRLTKADVTAKGGSAGEVIQAVADALKETLDAGQR